MTQKPDYLRDTLTQYRRALALILRRPVPRGEEWDEDRRLVAWLEHYVDALERIVAPDLDTVRNFAALEARSAERRRLERLTLEKLSTGADPPPPVKPCGNPK